MKMIALESLMDIDALPWQADWYRTKVREALGNRIDNEFRLYFIDHAQHTPPVGVPAQARTVSYQGALEQMLRDVRRGSSEGLSRPHAQATKSPMVRWRSPSARHNAAEFSPWSR